MKKGIELETQYLLSLVEIQEHLNPREGHAPTSKYPTQGYSNRCRLPLVKGNRIVPEEGGILIDSS
jgi:hypothetical protein